MRVEVKVPQLPESVSEATLVSWHRQPGEAVKRDENLIDVETDKVVLELPAPESGVLVEIVAPSGATVKSLDVIAIIDTEAKASARVAAPAAAPPAAAPAAPAPAAASATALPAARKLLAEQGVDPAGVEGTGRGGRITKGDVIAATAPKPAPAAAPPQAAPAAPAVVLPASLGNRPEQRVPMSRLRQRVAERLVQSQSTAAILTTFNEVNLGFMGFFVKAAVHALKRFPAVNASIDGTDIVYHGYFDIGIAVGSPRGLVVPIIRDADLLSIAEIEAKIADFGKRAGEGKLTVEELTGGTYTISNGGVFGTGGTYTISNGGVFGSMLSTPIINPPQSAILGVHATKERAVVENGQVVVRPINYLAQSYDHRIIDGREAVLSLVAIKEALEDPARLLLEL